MARKTRKRGTLRGYRSFHELFSHGRTVTEGMLRCYYIAAQENEGAVMVGFTTTRNVLSAARRNRIKRLLRESWKNAGRELQSLARETNQRIQMVFIYRVAAPNKHPQQRMIEASMGRTIKTVVTRLETSSQ